MYDANERPGMNYRWIDGPTASQEEWDQIDSMLAARGWMSLNRNLTRILAAEDDDGVLRGFMVLQFTPQAGPLWIAPRSRGTGVAEELADRMLSMLIESKARGWFVIADSPHSAALCESRGMVRIKSPVYTTEVPIA